jgi:hypothetical protein
VARAISLRHLNKDKVAAIEAVYAELRCSPLVYGRREVYPLPRELDP